MSNDLVITEYDPQWPHHFAEIESRLSPLLGPLAAAIEHVGSTAVPGLSAKPVIDLDVLLATRTDLPEAIKRLATLGYEHQGDLGIKGREAFQTPAGTFAHHLYVCVPDCEEFRRHIVLRDYLRTHPDEASAYNALKWSLVAQSENDRAAYIRGKESFVGKLVERAIESASVHRNLNFFELPTLILPNRHKPDFTLLWQTAIALKWRTERWPLRAPFPNIEGEIVPYFDPLTSAIFTTTTGVSFDEVALDWLLHVPQTYLRRRIKFGTLGQLSELVSGWEGPWFIKPAREKVFLAAVYDTYSGPAFDGVPGTEIVLVSGVVNFTQEWRFFIAHRKVEAFSLYARDGEGFRDGWEWQSDEEAAAVSYMEKILSDDSVPLLNSQVVDIGLASDGWAIIESNDSYASGLYACDPEGVLRALRATSRRLPKAA